MFSPSMSEAARMGGHMPGTVPSLLQVRLPVWCLPT